MEKFTLLYVDDEESNLRIFKNTFRRKFNVYTATSAKEGIDILDKQKVDLVLSDQRMPEMSGVEFLKYSLEQYPEPNRILITGYSDIEAIEHAVNHAHIFQYIQKPWDEEHLQKVIEDALRIYHLEKENKQQKLELIEAKEKAEESDRLKTEFINNMSHEIRTPMNGILGFSALLASDTIDNARRKEYVEIVQKSGNRLLGIIDHILEISKLGSEKVEIEEQEVCLNSLFATLHSTFSYKAKEKNIPVNLINGLSDEDSKVITDGSKLTIIISSLLENAIKFTSKGTIDFGYKLNGDSLHIYIKDTGVGIKPEDQTKIFDKFVQGPHAEMEVLGGLGLGLSIAKENAELIAGKITVESDEGKGAVFTLILPYKKPKQPTNRVMDTNSDFSNIGKKDYTVLVAEDEQTNYFLIETLLNEDPEHKYKILHAKNGEEAVSLSASNKNIDWVLMDIKMPRLNGYEATKLIKRMYPKLPIIAQTAYSTSNDRKKALAAGCDDYIAKPIVQEQLFEVINRCMKGEKAQ